MCAQLAVGYRCTALGKPQEVGDKLMFSETSRQVVQTNQEYFDLLEWLYNSCCRLCSSAGMLLLLHRP